MTRAYVKDFLGGIDPTGTFTTRYGLADAKKSKAEQQRRRLTGVVGGTLGGAVTLPMALRGGMALALDTPDVVRNRGWKALPKHIWNKTLSPVRTPYRAAVGLRALRNISAGKAVTGKDAQRVVTLLKDVGAPSKVLHGLGHQGGLMGYQKLLKGSPQLAAMHSKAVGLVKSRLRKGLTLLALSGLVTGGSSYVQHRMGSQLGKNLTAEQRNKLLK